LGTRGFDEEWTERKQTGSKECNGIEKKGHRRVGGLGNFEEKKRGTITHGTLLRKINGKRPEQKDHWRRGPREGSYIADFAGNKKAGGKVTNRLIRTYVGPRFGKTLYGYRRSQKSTNYCGRGPTQKNKISKI